jgi:CubicO group peptidase (beta-lactamase class C family)
MKKNLLFFILLALFIPLFLTSCTTTYMGRLLRYRGNPYENLSKLPNHIIRKSDEPFLFAEDNTFADSHSDKFDSITWMTSDGPRTDSLMDMLEDNESLAFLVIRDDIIVYEQYFDGRSRETLFPAFSVSKSITSALIGIAVDEGLLPGIDVPVKQYLPDFNREGYEKITIRNLLDMNAGFEHSYGLGPGDDLVISVLHPNVTELAMEQKIIRAPGECFEYNNYNTILLGMILENVTGMSPSEYLEKKIWQPIGTEQDASWSISGKNGFEYMGSGINAAIMDYAKFGRLYLNDGNWNSRQIINSSWIEESTTIDPSINGEEDYYDTQIGEVVNEYFDNEGYYSSHWWGSRNANGSSDYYAVGIYGQYIYICPDKNMIILRMGRDFGDVTWWPHVFKEIADRF